MGVSEARPNCVGDSDALASNPQYYLSSSTQPTQTCSTRARRLYLQIRSNNKVFDPRPFCLYFTYSNSFRQRAKGQEFLALCLRGRHNLRIVPNSERCFQYLTSHTTNNQHYLLLVF